MIKVTILSSILIYDIKERFIKIVLLRLIILFVCLSTDRRLEILAERGSGYQRHCLAGQYSYSSARRAGEVLP